MLQGCSLTYLIKAGYHQIKILKQRVPIEEVLEQTQIDRDVKKKLHLIQETKTFAENTLQLKRSDNYNSFVQLNRPYVTYLLRVSDSRQLESYQWSFPLMGKWPYKGYFSLREAKTAAKKFPKDQYDIYIRGVSAYSTLGWFNDPVLSSMLRYEDHILVDMIIHEMVHATLFIKGHTEFNERLASFMGQRGAEMFYRQKEGEDSPTLQIISHQNKDKLLFSEFISKEIKELRKWYIDHQGFVTEESKSKRLRRIQENFKKNLKFRLKSSYYDYFQTVSLNNAKLLSYETYVGDLSDFQALYEKMGGDFLKMMTGLKTLSQFKNPQKALKENLL